MSNALATTNVFAATETLTGTTGQTTLNVTGNLYVSNAITTTNITCAGFTSNISNTIFNYDTLIIPFISSTTLNVASTSNLQTAFINTLNVASTSNLQTAFINTLNVASTSNLQTTFINTLNVASTSNLQTAFINTLNVASTSNLQSVTYSLDVLAQGPYLNPSTANAAIITQWYSRLVNTTSRPFWSVSAAPQFSYINTSNLVGYASQTLLNDGRVLFNQINGNNIGFFYPDTNQFSYITGVSISNFDYSGVLQIPDGRVVFIPCNGNKVGLLNSFNYSFSTVSTGTALTNMHYGGVYEPSGNVIMTPTNSSNVGIFNTNTGTYSRVAFSSDVNVVPLYYGSVLLPDGRVVFIPNGTSNVGIYTPSTAVYSNVTVTVNGKYAGGCLMPDGNVFMVPNLLSSNACIYNPNLNTVSNVAGLNGTVVGGGGGAGGAVSLPDGRILIMPSPSNTGGSFIIYNFKTGTYAAISGPPGGSMQGALIGGGTLVPDGRVIITTQYGAGLLNFRTPAPREFCLHPFFNKF